MITAYMYKPYNGICKLISQTVLLSGLEKIQLSED